MTITATPTTATASAITTSELDCLDNVVHEVLVFIKCEAHPVQSNGDVSQIVNFKKKHLQKKITAKSRAEAIQKIDEYMEEVKACLS